MQIIGKKYFLEIVTFFCMQKRKADACMRRLFTTREMNLLIGHQLKQLVKLMMAD